MFLNFFYAEKKVLQIIGIFQAIGGKK